MTSTSCGFIQHGRVKSDHSGGQTYGGWSKKITAHRRFICIIPKSYPLEKAGPVFCGGITMFSPLFENGAFKGKFSKSGLSGNRTFSFPDAGLLTLLKIEFSFQFSFSIFFLQDFLFCLFIW